MVITNIEMFIGLFHLIYRHPPPSATHIPSSVVCWMGAFADMGYCRCASNYVMHIPNKSLICHYFKAYLTQLMCFAWHMLELNIKKKIKKIC